MNQVRTITSKPKIRLRIGPNYSSVTNVVRENKLHTVCEEARCPNIYECWENGTATLMILGNVCTRACGFCSVKTGKPTWNDSMEPFRTALTVKKMRLRHVVITSVDRDDLKNDYGAEIWAETIFQIHSFVPDCTVEVLTPDFRGYYPALKKVFDSKPELFSHNLECVERVSRKVRPQSNWQRSLSVLQHAVDYGLRTKTSIMVGLGETKKEVLETMQQAVDLVIEIFTVGQYLQPTQSHLPVARYVSDNEFLDYKEAGLKIGFKIVESGPLVRSSYHADDQINRLYLDG